MLSAIIQFIIMFGCYLYQLNLVILSNGNTIATYVLPTLIIIFRLTYFLRIIGIPVNKNVPMVGELVVMFTGLLFMGLTSYDSGYELYASNLILTVGITLVIVTVEYFIVKSTHFILVEVEDDNDEEDDL